MLNAIRSAGLLVPSLFTIPALVVLIGLGSWQWQRKVWKEGLILQLAQSAKAEPQQLSDLDLGADIDELRFKRVRIAGQFAKAGEVIKEFHIWTPDKGGPDWRVISPFRLQQPIVINGQARSLVLVIRGRVSKDVKSAQQRINGQITGPTTIVGRLRFAETNWATPEPNLQANEWYALDLDRMLANLPGAGERSDAPNNMSSQALPFFVEAERALAPPPAPQPDLKSIYLSNRHLEYAVTWWGLALTLIAVYLAFVRARLKARAAG